MVKFKCMKIYNGKIQMYENTCNGKIQIYENICNCKIQI